MTKTAIGGLLHDLLCEMATQTPPDAVAATDAFEQIQTMSDDAEFSFWIRERATVAQAVECGRAVLVATQMTLKPDESPALISAIATPLLITGAALGVIVLGLKIIAANEKSSE